MKKIIDFEIVCLLTIIILASVAIFTFKYGEVIDISFFEDFFVYNQELFEKVISEDSKLILENKTLEIINGNNIIEVSIILISLYILVFTNAIYFLYKIFKLFSKIKSKKIYRNDQLNNEDIEELNLTTYDLVSALIVYYKRMYLTKTQYLFDNFYKSQKYLLENNEINIELMEKLPENEQELLKYIQFENKIIDELKSPSWSEIKADLKDYLKNTIEAEEEINIENEEEIDKKILYLKILNNLKKEKLVKSGTISMFLDKVIDFFENLYNKLPSGVLKVLEKISKGLKELQRSHFEFKRKAGVNIFIFVLIFLWCIMFSLTNIYITMIFTLSLIIFMFIFGDIVFLTKKGIIEREKICIYRKTLKNKEDLTEREKLFLNLLN